MLALTITAIIFVVTQAILARIIDSWWKVNASADAQQQLYKAQAFLERDLSTAAYERESGRETLGINKSPSDMNHLSGADGDVLWFLSAIDPISGDFQRLNTGQPFWQRNILYYCVTPSDASLTDFGFSGAGLDVAGYESACPFKVLIRKEIDSENPTTAGGAPEDIENLMTYDDIAPLLDRPNGYSVAGMASPQVSVRPISGNILTFRADFANDIRGVHIDIRSTGTDRARLEGSIGSRDLSTNPATQGLRITVFPPNRQGDASTTPEP